jgi:hypothetical protein
VCALSSWNKAMLVWVPGPCNKAVDALAREGSSSPFLGPKPAIIISPCVGTLDRKQCRLVTGLVTDHCTFRWHLHIMGLLESTKCRKCGQEESKQYKLLTVRYREPNCHAIIVCQQHNQIYKTLIYRL